MDLSLNADAALRAYLPPESWNGDAQHRFVFCTEDGEEEALLARLAVIQPDVNNERFHHCVVLRPENAEPSRVFIAENLWYRSGRKEIDSWMTPRVARRFNWPLFEQSFNDSNYTRGLSRFWSVKQQNRTVVLRVGADGWGDVLGFTDPETGHTNHSEGIIWDRDYRAPHDQKDLRFLRQSHVNFRRQIRSRWKASDGDIQAAIKWQCLDQLERNALAFRCGHFDWSTLQSIAALALVVRLSRLVPQPNTVCEWDFVAYGEISVSGANLYDDSFLFEWRAAIVQVFQPDNVDVAGKMIDKRPLCVWSHVGDSELRGVRVEPFSQHELIEAELKLRVWAREHLPTDEAERLLAL